MPDLKISFFNELTVGRLAFSGKVRERCLRKLERQLRTTHLPLEHCFRILAERADREKSSLRFVYRRIVQSLEAGHKIGKALSPFAAPEEVMLIDSGQTGGEFSLADGFRRAAELMAQKRNIRGLLIKELSYPILLLGGVIGFLIVVATVLMPQLSVLSDPLTWHGAAGVLYGVSNYIASTYGLITGGAILAVLIAIWLSLPRWSGPGRSIADRFPPWSLYRVLVGVSWLYATAILLQTRDLKLVTIIRQILNNPDASRYLKSRLRPVHANTQRGLNLGDALWATNMRWPDPAIVDDLRTYAALPGFNSQLSEIADEMMIEAMAKIQRGASILGIISIVFLVVSMVMLVSGIFSIQQQITHGIGA